MGGVFRFSFYGGSAGDDKIQKGALDGLLPSLKEHFAYSRVTFCAIMQRCWSLRRGPDSTSRFARTVQAVHVI